MSFENFGREQASFDMLEESHSHGCFENSSEGRSMLVHFVESWQVSCSVDVNHHARRVEDRAYNCLDST